MISISIIFTSLVFVHLIADFYLQPHSWIMSKVKYREKSLGLLKHMTVHLVLTGITLYILLGGFTGQFWIALGIIIISHYGIDIWKTYMGFTIKYFLIDQGAHVLILTAVSIWLSGLPVYELALKLINTMTFNHVIYLMAYLVAYKPASILIQLLLRPYLQQFEDPEKQNSGLQTAGEHIGGLERTLVITFVLLEQFAGIGFLLAAKSVFRFGDMRRQHDRKLTEYIMLGTLLSFTFAILLGLLAFTLANG